MKTPAVQNSNSGAQWQPSSPRPSPPAMKVLILNQAFYPDVVSTAQHAADLAVALVQAGHGVTVVCNSRGYDDPNLRFPSREVWNGINIVRVPSLGLGKANKWRRAADFAIYVASCAARIVSFPKYDVVIAMTSPPLVSFIAALAVPRRARRLVFWSMDLNPDEAIAAGWLREGSLLARLLSRMLLYSMKSAKRIIALDRFMKARIEAKGIDSEKIVVIPPWSHDDHVSFDLQGREEFRIRHGLCGKFVVMYSGNHSPCHPLDTFLQAAECLASRNEIVFCFVGGGSEFRKVQACSQERGLRNILCLPYQPIQELSASLSAADLHVIVMGDKFVGIVHPCKIYNVLAVQRRFLYIGPSESHISDIICELPVSKLAYRSRQDDVEGIVGNIVKAMGNCVPATLHRDAVRRFSKEVLITQVIAVLKQDYGQESNTAARDRSAQAAVSV